MAIFALLAFSPCSPKNPADNQGPPALTNAMDREEQDGISLLLSVEQTELDVGDEIRMRVAFRNDSDKSNFVVPPIDGSWDDREQPAYHWEFSDSDGKPVPHALGYKEYTRDCGLTDHYRLEDRRIIGPHNIFELTEEQLQAPILRVLKHARPGPIWLRVRYRADELAGVAPIDIVSNPVKLMIRGSDEYLWECSNALVEKAEIYQSADNEPVKLVAHGDGYLLVYRHRVAHVQSKNVVMTHEIFIQELDSRGELVRDAIEVAQYEFDRRWPGDLKVITVPGGLLVAFTALQANKNGEVRVVSVDTSHGAPRPSSIQSYAATQGIPIAIAMTRAGDHVGLVWQDVVDRDIYLGFQALELNGVAAGIPQLMFTNGRARANDMLLEPIANDFVLVWHEWYIGQRFQRIGADGTLLGDVTSGPFDRPVNAIALGTNGKRIKFAYFEEGKREIIELSPKDFSQLANSPAIPMRSAYGAAIWVDEQLFGISYRQDEMIFGSESDSASSPQVLSEKFGRNYDIGASADGGKLLVTWQDYRDDDSRHCKETRNCATEVYIAVFDSKKRFVVPPRRITRTSVRRPAPIEPTDLSAKCGSHFAELR